LAKVENDRCKTAIGRKFATDRNAFKLEAAILLLGEIEFATEVPLQFETVDSRERSCVLDGR
jgi:hypothetical protein